MKPIRLGFTLFAALLMAGGAAFGASCDGPVAGDDNRALARLIEQGCYSQAGDLAGRMIPAAPDDSAKGWLFNSLGVIHEKSGQLDLAAGDYRRALELIGDDPAALTLQVNLAALQYRRGDYPAARSAYQEALALLKKQGAEADELRAAALGGLGLVLQTMGQYNAAITPLQQALELDSRRFGDNHAIVALDLSNLGDVHRSLGEYDQALPLYRRSLSIRRNALPAAHPDIANSLSKIGYVLEIMGRPDQALSAYQEALQIREKSLQPGHSHIALAHAAVADALRQLGRGAEAMPHYQIALTLAEQALPAGHPDIARILHFMGQLQYSSGQVEQAIASLQRAVDIRSEGLGPFHPLTAKSMGILGGYLAQSADEKTRARGEQMLSAAFAIALPSGELSVIVETGGALQQLYAQRGNSELAIFHGKQTVNTLQRIRQQSKGLDKELQQSLLEKNEAVYKRLADLLFAQGRLMEGQQVLAMLKEAEYFDFIQRNSSEDPRSTQSGFDGREQPWADRYQQISSQLAQLAREREALVKKARLGLTPDEQRRKDQLDADQMVARRAYEAFIVELRQEFTASNGSAARSKAERDEEFGAKNLDGLRALQGTLRDLGQGAVTLHYLMTDQRLWILLTTPSLQIKREAAVGEAELGRLIAAYRDAIARRDPAVNVPGRALYDLIIAPVADDLAQTGAQTLMVSLDGALRYLPLAALYDGKQFLAQRYRLALFTEVSKDKLKDKPQDDWMLAGFGLTARQPGFNPLPSVKGEFEGITRDIPGTVKLDGDFTASSLKTGLEGEPPVVHLASHFVFKPGNETDSFLLLGDGSRLSLQAIKEGYEFRNVDLLTLSACETAVGGGRDANGREVEGFAVQAQKQGAKGVIATLWPVADQSTGQFMQLFYGFRQHGMTKALAMQQAQRAFIEGRVSAALAEVSRGPVRAGSPPATAATTTDHPYYWAPFILMGNWL
ncbi:MAG: CHAT domain-containing protein [Gallionella sp.]|nr:CHAT domain-containing protein [Gallionella sp.]